MSARTVITGLGVVAPSGTSAAEHWATVTAGTSRLGPIQAFDASGYQVRIAGEVPAVDIPGSMEGRLMVQTDRWTQLAFVAVEGALADAALELPHEDPYQVSVAMASSSGGNQFGQRELQRLWGQPSRTVGAYQSIAWFYAATVGQLSIRHQAKGPCSVLAAESAGGLDSLAHAARTIGRGGSVVLAGGLEAPLSPYALACQMGSGLLTADDDPASAYRPFDATASGYVPGEGGAVLIAESLDHARARNAPAIYAEIAGWGMTHDARHASRDPGHQQYARSMRLALERAGTAPHEVDLVIPDAMGVLGYDRSEARAISAVFGSRGVPVSTQKSLTGRLYQGGAALDVVTALMAMREQVIPPVTGLTGPAAEYDLDFVRTARETPVNKVLVCARGYDGYNSSVLLRRTYE
ncbi:MAG TPA: beta-ketoacyl synthase N-terminal-like domain-containing protein [Trebonia sp.]|jgi:minimal PKS chain-length factor (CLF/KS beta)|nr:beta-ketoacyl synthase N-terminal-like domain-containing protein [Trebonia sp.]